MVCYACVYYPFCISQSYKRCLPHGDDHTDLLACVGLNVLEHEEDAPVFLQIAPAKAQLIVLPIIDTPPVNDKIPLIGFELTKDVEILRVDSFPTVVLNQHVTVFPLNGSNATDLVGWEAFILEKTNFSVGGFQEAKVVLVARPSFALWFEDLLLLPNQPSNVPLGISLIHLDSCSKFFGHAFHKHHFYYRTSRGRTKFKVLWKL